MAAIKKTNRRKVAFLSLGALALGAAVAGNMLFTRPATPPPPKTVIVEKPAPRIDPTIVAEILIAAEDLPVGTRLTDKSTTWLQWPRAYLPQDAILREQFPNGVQGMINTAARHFLMKGDPMREAKIVRSGDKSGLLAAMLEPGWRPITVRLDPSGITSSGNFITPGDRVDVVLLANTRNPSEAVQVLYKNIKVLAINAQLGAAPNQNNIVANTATLMMKTTDAQKLQESERLGRISLVLRPIAEASPKLETNTVPAPVAAKKDEGQRVEMFRFGVQGR